MLTVIALSTHCPQLCRSRCHWMLWLVACGSNLNCHKKKFCFFVDSPPQHPPPPPPLCMVRSNLLTRENNHILHNMLTIMKDVRMI